MCKSLQFGEPPGPLTIPTVDANLRNIENDKVKTLCKKALDEFEKADIEMRPKQNYWFSG